MTKKLKGKNERKTKMQKWGAELKIQKKKIYFKQSAVFSNKKKQKI